MRLTSENGQAAVVDAILFMTVMLISTAVIIGSTVHIGGTDIAYAAMSQYSGDFSATLLAIELEGMHYKNAEGATVHLNGSGRSVGRLLCDEAMLLSDPGCDFTDYNARILAAGSSLIRPDLGFAISCNRGPVFISRDIVGPEELPPDRWASSLTVSIGGDPVEIMVFVWVV